MSKASNPNWQIYYDYLDELRESGATNMFGASSWLVRKFGLHKSEAMEVLSSWMKEFGS